MNNKIIIRLATPEDASALLNIYKPYVLDTSLTPEFEVPNLLDFKERIKQITCFYPYLVCLHDNRTAGYAYAHRYRVAAGHQWSAETTIYLSQRFQGKGLAGILYETLLAILKLQNFINVFAGIILPNDPSIAFHQKHHFTDVGIFKEGIYKSGSWHDVKWMQLIIRNHEINPPAPKSLNEIIHTTEYHKIMEMVNDQ